MSDILKNWKRKIRKFINKKKTKNPWLPPQYNNIEIGNLIFGNSRGQFPVERGEFEETFVGFLQSNGFNSYGHYFINDRQEWIAPEDNISYENATFLIRPYYWGTNEAIAKKPNFVYKPRNLEIKWYKYPFRDSYSNEKFTITELKTILEECTRSLRNV